MPERIAELEHTVTDETGCIYFVYVIAELVGASWEGWLEFVPMHDSAPLLTPIETHQATRDAVADWGAGLSDVYVQGAFRRATAPP